MIFNLPAFFSKQCFELYRLITGILDHLKSWEKSTLKERFGCHENDMLLILVALPKIFRFEVGLSEFLRRFTIEQEKRIVLRTYLI